MAGSTQNSNVNPAASRQQTPSSRIKRKARISVPMTAMIDVTFLLLIYFLTTTTFRQDEGQLPGTLPGKIAIGPPPETVPVQLRAVGDDSQSVLYSIDGVDQLLRSPRELVESLRDRRQRTGENAIVVIKAGRNVRWRYVVEACNQAASANFQTTISM
jgi:biopolymer transport protein ExbD